MDKMMNRILETQAINQHQRELFEQKQRLTCNLPFYHHGKNMLIQQMNEKIDDAGLKGFLGFRKYYWLKLKNFFKKKDKS